MSAGWEPDILGGEFQRLTLDLGHDDEGPLDATLIRHISNHTRWTNWTARLLRRRPLPWWGDVDVLSLHGWSDYFFQRSHARFWSDRGARFFALDLRKYGRSLHPAQTPGYITDLTDYHADIDAALQTIRDTTGDRSSSGRRVLLMGHSTGGLIASLWAADHPGQIDGLVLNSPWLEFQLAGTGRSAIGPLLALGARYYPRDAAPQIDEGFYARAQHQVGPADDLALINPAWRPDRSHPVTAGWLQAILAGHARIHQGVHLSVPVLVLLSARSALPTAWRDEFQYADTVLDVTEIAKAALNLGPTVTIARIDDALHDVFLSAPAPRAQALDQLRRWVTGWHATLELPLP